MRIQILILGFKGLNNKLTKQIPLHVTYLIGKWFWDFFVSFPSKHWTLQKSDKGFELIDRDKLLDLKESKEIQGFQ